MNQAYLSLGSNLGERLIHLQTSINTLSEYGKIVKCSSVYETAPWGFESNSPFLNICLLYETSLSSLQLLERIKAVEIAQGRVRDGETYSSRTIDIDIILFNDLIIQNEELCIPHLHYRKRAFVLIPLHEIAPELQDPRDGVSIKDLLVHSADECSVAKITGSLNY